MGMYFESCLADLILAVVLFLSTLFIYVKFYVYQHWSRNNIAQLRPRFPFGDSSSILFRKKSLAIAFYNMYQKFRSKNVSLGGYYFTYRPELMIMDPEIIKQILVKDFQHFTDRGTFSDEKNDPLSAHLFSLNGQKWKNLRMKLTPTFTSGKMKMMFGTLVTCSDELNNVLKEIAGKEEAVDIKDILARFTMDVIGSCAFGIDCNCLKNPDTDFRKYGIQTFEPVGFTNKCRGLVSFLFPRIFKFFKIRAVAPEVSEFFLGIVNETVKYREENNINRKDFMQLLLYLKNGKMEEVLTDDESSAPNAKNNKMGLTVEQIAAQCFVFFLAGFETSSTTMTFCLYELSKNQELQQKVREEVNTVLQKHGNKLTYEAIMEMHYMEQVINETLRKYPPLAFLNRACTKEYKIPKSNYVMQKGEIIRISTLGLQRDPEYYPDPDKFDPERFNEKNGSIPPFTFMPFGEGPRICIGLRFGMMQTKVGLTVLLKNYKFTLNKKTSDPLVFDPNNVIISSLGGIWLDAHKICA